MAPPTPSAATATSLLRSHSCRLLDGLRCATLHLLRTLPRLVQKAYVVGLTDGLRRWLWLRPGRGIAFRRTYLAASWKSWKRKACAAVSPAASAPTRSAAACAPVFHNGGGYNFHFLLRYIAAMGSLQGPREELGKNSNNNGTKSEAEAEGSDSKSERPMPMAKAAPKAAPKARPLWCALQATTKQGYYSHLSLQVLCKSDKKCLRMISIPLRFVDSMNVFLTSLASMINNLRACARKQLPELFPLMASLRPKLQLRTPTDSPPQRRPFKQRRTH